MIKPYKLRNGPNRLQDVQVRKLDPEGTVGFVVLDTDHGRVQFGINKGMAELLRAEMTEFLEGKAEAMPE